MRWAEDRRSCGPWRRRAAIAAVAVVAFILIHSGWATGAAAGTLLRAHFPAAVALGKPVEVSVRVSAPMPSTRLVLQQLERHRWKTMSRATIGGVRSVSLSFRVARLAPLTLRVEALQGARSVWSSPQARVVVRRQTTPLPSGPPPPKLVLPLTPCQTSTVPSMADPDRGSTLTAGAELQPGWYLIDGSYTLVMQPSGDLVEYSGASAASPSGGLKVWDSKTAMGMTGVACLDPDGNFAVYHEGMGKVWESGTSGNPNALLTLTSAGDVVIAGANGQRLWDNLHPAS